MLPLPYAPNIDVDAERLRMAREKGTQPAVDVGAGIAQGITTGLSLKSALDADNAKAAAAAFQKEYLDKGNEGIQKMYVDAGSPTDFNINAYVIPEGTPPAEAQKIALLAAKDLTAKAEKDKAEKGRTNLSAVIADPTKTESDVAAAAIPAGATTGELLTFSKDIAKNKATAATTEQRKAFLKALPSYEQRAMKAARSAEEKASLQTEIASKYGDVKEAMDWVNAIPVKETSGLDAAREARDENRRIREQQNRDTNILRYSLDPQTEQARTVISSLRGVDEALKNLGVAGGIWDKGAAKAMPGRAQKWTKDLRNDPKIIDLYAVYNRLSAEERKRLFGATLTAGEGNAFDQLFGNKEIQNPQYIISGLQRLAKGAGETLMYPGSEEEYDIIRNRGGLTVEDVPGFGTAIKPRGYLAKRVKAPAAATTTPAGSGKKIGRFDVVVGD